MAKQLSWLPPRPAQRTVVAQPEDEERISSLLALLLDRCQWQRLNQLMHLLNLTLDCCPAAASVLCAAGAASIVAGVLQRCSQAPAATCAVLRYASLQLLLRLLRAGDRVTPHLTTRDLLSTLLHIMEPSDGSTGAESLPGSGADGGARQLLLASHAAARRAAVELMLRLCQHTRGGREAVVAAGVLPVLVAVLRDVPSLCDLELTQAALRLVSTLSVEAGTLSLTVSAGGALPTASSTGGALPLANSTGGAFGSTGGALPSVSGAASEAFAAKAAAATAAEGEAGEDESGAASPRHPGRLLSLGPDFANSPTKGLVRPAAAAAAAAARQAAFTASLASADGSAESSPRPLSSRRNTGHIAALSLPPPAAASTPQLTAALLPLLQVYRLPRPHALGGGAAGSFPAAAPPSPPAEAQLLALVLRALHVLLANDTTDECREVLRAGGTVQALVSLLKAHAYHAQAAPGPSPGDYPTPASGAAACQGEDATAGAAFGAGAGTGRSDMSAASAPSGDAARAAAAGPGALVRVLEPAAGPAPSAGGPAEPSAATAAAAPATEQQRQGIGRSTASAFMSAAAEGGAPSKASAAGAPEAAAAAAGMAQESAWQRLLAALLLRSTAARSGAAAVAAAGGITFPTLDGSSGGGAPAPAPAPAPSALVKPLPLASAQALLTCCYALLLPVVPPLAPGSAAALTPPPLQPMPLDPSGADPGLRRSSSGAEERAAQGDHAVLPVPGLWHAKEAAALLRALLMDSPADQALAVASGAIPVLIQLVATGDMEVAWVATELLGTLGPDHHAQLLKGRAVEAVTGLLQEAADALHLLTVQAQLRDVRAAAVTAPAAAPGQGKDVGTAGAREAGAAAAAAATAALGAPPPVQPPQLVRQQHAARPGRVHLVGRQHPQAFHGSTCGSTCMYAAAHGTATFCDVCIPSAALRTLLRLLDPNPDAFLPHTFAGALTPGLSPLTSPLGGLTPPSQLLGASGGLGGGGGAGGPALDAKSDVLQRFASAGGVYTLFLLMHHEEVAGMTHSKLAQSLITFIGHILANRPGAQDEVRQVGGLAILSSLLQRLMRPGVTDIYQLRVSVCMALKLLVEGNAANKLLAREHGLLRPLMDLLRLALGQPDAAAKPAGNSRKGAAAAAAAAAAGMAEVSLLDAEEQVAVAAMEAIGTCIPGSSGNQETFISLGLAKLLYDLLCMPQRTPTTYAAALRLTAALCEGGGNAMQRAVLGAGLLARAGSIVDETQNWGEVAAAYCYLLYNLLRYGPPDTKGRILVTGGLRILLHTLNYRPASASTEWASCVLQALVLGDVDLQNEVASQGGGLHTAYELICRWHGTITHSMFRLLVALASGNSFVKNLARQSGFLPLLLAVLRGCALTDPQTTVLAAQAATALVQSNHASQTNLADEGGIDILAELLHVVIISSPGAVGSHRPGMLATPSAAAQGAAGGGGLGAGPSGGAAGARGSATGGAAGGGGEGVLPTQVQLDWARSNPMYEESLDGASSLSRGASLGFLSPEASKCQLSPAASTHLVPMVGAAAGAGGPGGGGDDGGDDGAALGPLARAAQRGGVLEALLQLLAATAEFNAGNQARVREAGGLLVLLHFLRAAAALPEPAAPALAAARLTPALCAACAALARLTQDCPDNQLCVMEGTRLPGPAGLPPGPATGAGGRAGEAVLPAEGLRPMLYRLLELNDPGVALETAKTLEYITLGFSNSPELEDEAVRMLVKALHSRGGGGGGAAAGAAPLPLPTVPVSVVREASVLLQQVIQACNSVLVQSGGTPVEAPGLDLTSGVGGADKAGRGKGAAASAAAKGKKAANPAPVAPAAAGAAPVGGTAAATGAAAAVAVSQPSAIAMQPLPSLPASFAAALPGDGGRSSPRNTASSDGSLGGAPPFPGPLPPSAVPGPGPGPAASQQQLQQWQQVVGRSAGAFQAVAAAIPEGPWKAVLQQLAWVLFLLAVKSRVNLELLVRLLRTTLLPLIQQLENAEVSLSLVMQALEQQQAKLGQQQAAATAGHAVGRGQDGVPPLLPGSGGSTGPLPVSTFANDSAAYGGGSGGGSGSGGGAETLGIPLAVARLQVPAGRGAGAAAGALPGSPGASGSGAAWPMAGSPSYASGSPFKHHAGGGGSSSYMSPLAVARPGDDLGGGEGALGMEEQPGGGRVDSSGLPLSPESRRLTSDDEDWELAMIRQEVALASRTGPAGSGGSGLR